MSSSLSCIQMIKPVRGELVHLENFQGRRSRQPNTFREIPRKDFKVQQLSRMLGCKNQKFQSRKEESRVHRLVGRRSEGPKSIISRPHRFNKVAFTGTVPVKDELTVHGHERGAFRTPAKTCDHQKWEPPARGNSEDLSSFGAFRTPTKTYDRPEREPPARGKSIHGRARASFEDDSDQGIPIITMIQKQLYRSPRFAF